MKSYCTDDHVRCVCNEKKDSLACVNIKRLEDKDQSHFCLGENQII